MPRKRAETRELNIGEVSFLAGILIAVVAGFLGTAMDQTLVTLVLLVLGTIVGFLNLRKEEYTTFLLVGLVFLLPGGLGVLETVPILSVILKNISTFVAPAVLIVAVKVLVETASTK